MKISQETITQIREANPVELVIGSYISLKKAGKNYKALCPFHPEKTPSFFVAPEKGIFHCFGCGKSGNVFTFMMEYNNLSFTDAVKILGEKAGIRIESSGIEYEDLYKTNKFAADFYHSMLMKDKKSPPWQWIKNRQLKEATIEKFMLGYAPPTGYIMADKAKDNGISIEDLNKVGLFSNGKPTFRNKIIFPIKNRWGKILGFGTRVLDNSEPKYINSFESPIFKKGNILYGLYEAGKFTKDEIILVEGYMDLITLQETGINNVVASMGTSLTETQARLLKVYTKRVLILYDGDDSGKKAAERAMETLLGTSMEIKLLTLPEDEDPDSFIRKGNDLSSLKSDSFVEFIAGKFENCSNADEKTVFIKNLQQSLARIPDEVKRELLIIEIAEKININKKFLSTNPNSTETFHKKEQIIAQKSIENLEIELLGLAASSPKVREYLIKNLFEVSSETLKPLFKLVYEGISYPELLTKISNETLMNILTKMGLLLETTDTDLEKMAVDYITHINKLKKTIRKNELRKTMEKGMATEENLREYQQLVGS